MNKKVVLLLLFVIFIIPNTVLAYRIPCTTKNLNKLKNAAYSVNITYDFKDGENNTHYFEIYVSGLTSGLEVRYGNMMVSYDANKDIQSITTNEGGNVTYNFDIYAAPGSACDGYKVLSKSITLPKYNVYSEREECVEYEEFRLCNKWSKENIPNGAYFDDELAKYKASLNKKSEDPDRPKSNIFDKFIDFYLDNLYICIPITIVLAGALVFIIIRSIIRRKNRIKINIKR